MARLVKHKYMLITILITVLTLFTAAGCSQSNDQIQVLNNKISESEEKIKALESEIDQLTKEKADLMLELDSIGAPERIKYKKGYQGNVTLTEDTTFKLMPTGISEILATLKAGTVVEALAVAEVTTYDPC
jgi:hypothetical protein